MSVQIFLYGKLSGIEGFLEADTATPSAGSFAGRCLYLSLYSEVLPRALLAELGLAQILLGTSGAGQFLVVLPQESLPKAEELLAAAARDVSRRAPGLRLVWASTENLGDWSLVRKRLFTGLGRRLSAPGVGDSRAGEPEPIDFARFHGEFENASQAGWSPEAPAALTAAGGKHSWPLGHGDGEVPLVRMTALDGEMSRPATAAELAARAAGYPAWGVLCGDVDNFGVALRNAQTVEDYLRISRAVKQFFAGELEVAHAAVPGLANRLTVLYSGGDDFAVYGSWDALVQLAREIHRVFHLFSEQSLKDVDGLEGKTISMALAIAPGVETPLGTVHAEAFRLLEFAKNAGKDCFHFLGHPIDWKQFARADDLRITLLRLIGEFQCPPGFLTELSGFYRERPHLSQGAPPGRPWRYHRKIRAALGEAPGKDFVKLRNAVISEMIGGSAQHVKLRPAGRLAAEWARLSIEANAHV
jgi:CRISPR-associated protein Csm1